MNPEHGWIPALRRYLTVSAIGNGVWETMQLPLYTIWGDGTPGENAFAVLHCTAGDILIALSVWAFAVLVAGRQGWPAETAWRIAVLTVAAGLAYTGFSEWLNTAVRQNWTYSGWMPVLPGLGVGLSPVLQWLLVPALALWFAGRGSRRRAVPRFAR